MRRRLFVAALGATALTLVVIAVSLGRPEAGAAAATGPRRASVARAPSPTIATAPRGDDDEPGSVVGQVLDESGAPCAGAVVALVWLGSDERDDDDDSNAADSDAADSDAAGSDGADRADLLDALPEIVVARTDARGRFRIATDRIGRARLTATHGRAIAAAAEPIIVGPPAVAAPSPTTLHLGGATASAASTRIEARAREPEGSPVADALVLARLPGAGLVFAARTDGSGAATLAVPGWPDAVFARAEGYEDAAAPAATTMRGHAVVESDLVLVPGATLTGRVVVEASGEPAGGARVRVVGGGGERRVHPSTRADAAGRFRLTVSAGEVVARARRGGLVGVSSSLALERGQTAEVVIALAPGARVTGIVRDVDERPIAGAHVRGDDATAVSAADGTFVLDGIQRLDAHFAVQRVEVKATHPDYCRASDQVVLDPSAVVPPRVELTLRRCDTLTGVVLDPEGRPAAGAWVELDHSRSTTTDPAGRFRFAGLPRRDDDIDGTDGADDTDDRHELETSTVDARGIARTRVADGPVTIRLERAAAVCGTVRDDEGRPVPRADVTVDGRHFVADARGAYCAGPLAEGEVTLSADDGVPVTVTLARAERRDGVTLIGAARYRDVRGVVDSADGPVWGARLSGCGASATSAADGSFTLAAPTDARCGYLVRAPGYVDKMVELDAGDGEARVTLERAPRIVGEVVDEAGRPVTRFGLVVRSSDATYEIRDPRGAFDVAVEGPGAYSLLVRTSDGRAGATPLLEVEAGQTARARIVLGSACVMRGRIVTRRGRPVRANVYAGQVIGESLGDGRFVIAPAVSDTRSVHLKLLTAYGEMERDVSARCGGELDDIVTDDIVTDDIATDDIVTDDIAIGEPEPRGRVRDATARPPDESEDESRAPEDESR
jgi:protocatechuate 3,4-dioxygenase beta subunit